MKRNAKLRLFIIYILFILVSTTSCSGEKSSAVVVDHDQFSENVSIADAPSEIQGTGLGFVKPEHRDIPPFERPQTEEINIGKYEDLSIYLVLLNNSEKEITFLVTALLDYQQINFSLDGKEGILHEVYVPPSTELELPMNIDVAGDGMHDLQVVAFEDPYNKTLQMDYRMNIHGYVASRRAVIVKGKNENPVRKIKVIEADNPPQGESFGFPLLFAKSPSGDTPSHPSQRQLYVDQAKAGETYSFQLWLSNHGRNETVDLALIPFMDYKQVKLRSQDMFQEVLVVHLEPNEEAILDAEIKLPQNPGVHQMQFVYLYDPYKSILHNEVFSPFVYGSPRVAIDVYRKRD